MSTTMDRVRSTNLLYRRPELYEKAYSDFIATCNAVSATAIVKYGEGNSGTVLDVGCGTGVNLDAMSSSDGSIGIDVQDHLLDYGRAKRPHLTFAHGDMRECHLEREFDTVISFGFPIANLYTNADISAAFDTFERHTRSGSLLVLDCINPISNLHGERLPRFFTIEDDDEGATGEAFYQLDARSQLLRRKRTWVTDAGEQIDDFSQFRLIFPQELYGYLESRGFEILQMTDHADLTDGTFAGPYLYLVCRQTLAPR